MCNFEWSSVAVLAGEHFNNDRILLMGLKAHNNSTSSSAASTTDCDSPQKKPVGGLCACCKSALCDRTLRHFAKLVSGNAIAYRQQAGVHQPVTFDEHYRMGPAAGYCATASASEDEYGTALDEQFAPIAAAGGGHFNNEQHGHHHHDNGSQLLGNSMNGMARRVQQQPQIMTKTFDEACIEDENFKREKIYQAGNFTANLFSNAQRPESPNSLQSYSGRSHNAGQMMTPPGVLTPNHQQGYQVGHMHLPKDSPALSRLLYSPANAKRNPFLGQPAAPGSNLMLEQNPKMAMINRTPPKDAEKKIKRPLNAFMIFMREKRTKYSQDYKVKESALVNQIIAKEWNALSPEEQQPYRDQAAEEKAAHQKLYPNYHAGVSRESFLAQYNPHFRTMHKKGTKCKVKCATTLGISKVEKWCDLCRNKRRVVKFAEKLAEHEKDVHNTTTSNEKQAGSDSQA